MRGSGQSVGSKRSTEIEDNCFRLRFLHYYCRTGLEKQDRIENHLFGVGRYTPFKNEGLFSIA